MITQDSIQATPGACFAYYGDRGDWPIVLTITRDSECLDLSNFRVAQRMLDKVGAADCYAVERSSHWAVGWLDRLLIDPACVAARECAESIHARLEDYPVLDEDDWAQCEDDCAQACGYSYDCFTENHGGCVLAHGDCDCACHPIEEDDDDE